MIVKGSSDETEARHHLALWQGMLPHWNEEADVYRGAARGRIRASYGLLDEADRSREAIREALALADTLCDNLAPGHELRGELFRISATLEALSASMAISAEQMAPRIEADREVAGLRYLVSALKAHSGLARHPNS